MSQEHPFERMAENEEEIVKVAQTLPQDAMEEIVEVVRFNTVSSAGAAQILKRRSVHPDSWVTPGVCDGCHGWVRGVRDRAGLKGGGLASSHSMPPRVMKDNVEVMRSIPQECVRRADKQVVEVPASQILERIVQVGTVIPQERLVERVEETVEGKCIESHVEVPFEVSLPF